MTKAFTQELLAAFAGFVVGALGVAAIQWQTATPDSESSEYHVHADFLIQTGDTVHDFSSSTHMTSAVQELHSHAHLHDEVGDVLHLHARDISFVTFLDSLGVTLTDDCLTLPTTTSYCETSTSSLELYVNETRWTEPIANYVPEDLDRILLYYGSTSGPALPAALKGVPNDACIYSGSCPERGVAPPESCGLTCELE